jgi:hypothetical protein
MKPGKFDEQPMPETIIKSLGLIPNLPAAIWSARSTPKSPHPAHQSGSTSLA